MLDMKRPLILIAVAILLATATFSSNADQTNLVQNFQIQLFGVKQGGTATYGNITITSVDVEMVGTRDVIRALGTATGNNYSRAAKLVVVSPLAGGNSSVQVRDGDLNTDVSGFFSHEQTSPAVSGSQSNSRTGRSSTMDFNIQTFSLHDSEGTPLSLHFSVQGVSIDTTVNNPNSGVSSETNANVSGSGDQDGGLLILQGTIGIRGRTLEVVPGDPVAPGV